jgi:hypothetical protein
LNIRKNRAANKALHQTVIPLRFIAAGELGRRFTLNSKIEGRPRFCG